MKSETPLDYAVFQLSPRRSRCELLAFSRGNTEKLASGSVKPFATHLKVVEEQVALSFRSIKLENENRNETWFTKGTLERFVRFVSTPEVLETVNTFDAEMSQLEAARRIYSQGAGDRHFGSVGDGVEIVGSADETKKELLRAIDVRLLAVRQDLATAWARASAAGFNLGIVSDLQLFANRFGAHRLNEACSSFISLSQRRHDLISSWKPCFEDKAIRSSSESDMSIDDFTDDHNSSNVQPNHQNQTKLDQQPYITAETKQLCLDQSLLSMHHQPKEAAFASTPNVNVKDIPKEVSVHVVTKKEKSKEEALTNSALIPANPSTRRLSVQDRINLFENRQKENSNSSSGNKPSVGKSADLRRVSSDVSSAPSVVEKAALTGDKKDEENPSCTPSSASNVDQTKSNSFSGACEDENMRCSNDSGSSTKLESLSGSVRASDVGMQDRAQVQTGLWLLPGKEEMSSKAEVNWKDQTTSLQIRSSAGRTEPVWLNDQGVPQEKLKTLSSAEERSSAFKDNMDFEKQLMGFSQTEDIVVKRQVGASASKVGNDIVDGEIVNKVEYSRMQDISVNQSHSRGSQSHSQSLSGHFDGGIGIKLKEAPSAQFKGVVGDRSAPQTQWRSLSGEHEKDKNDLSASDKQHTKKNDHGVQRLKMQKPVSAGSEPTKKSQVRRDERNFIHENSISDLFSKKILGSRESSSTILTVPTEQVERVRQSKGNQELNKELKLKANELEKLFAEHKLRIPVDQSGSARRSRHGDLQVEQAVGAQCKKEAVPESAPLQLPDRITVTEPTTTHSSTEDLNITPGKMKIDNQEYGDALRNNFSELCLSDNSRGKLYEKYMLKRDAKLREQWGSRRAEKEAKMMAMQNSLEKSKAEMEAKFSGFADKEDSVASARRRAEKLRSFNYRSSMKREQPNDSIQSEEDEETPDILEQKTYGEDRLYSDTYLGVNASRSAKTKVFPNRTSSTRTMPAPAPRSASKVSNSSSGRRRGHTENPLAQSVPNFSDLRKENTKPSSGVSKATIRPQVRNYARSKSIGEEEVVKEEKPRRSQSLRKSSATPVEFKEISHFNSDNVVLAPLKYDKEQPEQCIYERYSKSVESKPFLRKGNGIGPGAGASIAKLKASMSSGTLKDDGDFDELAIEADDSVDMDTEEDEEELDTREIEDADLNNGKPRLSQDSDKSGISGSESSQPLTSLSGVDPASAAELPSVELSKSHAVESLQDSPGESPLSWNSRMLHPFSYPHETSDIDASVDSPVGSPASWNSHNITHTEADVARMRKKWGSAHKPTLVSNSSSQSRKDVTKGFKRLLKFGRRSRGTETLVDWISATTSEGDDDTEDGRDPASRSSEDLRKSRMGFSQGPSDDSFNESELFNEHVQALQSSIPAVPANFKLREDYVSGTSLKAPRSFFLSLPSEAKEVTQNPGNLFEWVSA